MEDNTAQAQYQADSLTYKFLNDPELMRSLNDININDLKRLGEAFQTVQHMVMLSINPADKDLTSLAVAMCRGANDFVYWLEAVKVQLKEIEIETAQRQAEVNAHRGNL